MQTFAEVIDEFGGPVPFAAAISVPSSHARTMKARNSVPPEYWPALIKAAGERGIKGVSADALMKIAADNAARRRPNHELQATGT